MSSSESSKKKGDKGEEEAAEHLRGLGYEILEMRWRFERHDLDLVAINETHIVFVEVKTRYSAVYGEPWEAVNKAKRKNICRSADAYLQQHATDKEPRFDIISIIKIGNRSFIEHIEEAFYPTA